MSRSRANNLSCILGIVWIALSMWGCATQAKNIKTIEEYSQAGEDSSIVFGQVEWLESGKVKKIGNGLLAMSIAPHLMKMEDKTRIVGEVNEGGQFVWSLKAGTYLIYKIAYRDPWSGNYFFVPKVVFDVPENGRIYYIGTLRSEFEPKRDIIGGLSGAVNFTIQDQGDKDFLEFQDRLNVSSNKIEKLLMTHDERLPQTVETTEEFNFALGIINLILYGASQ